MWTTGNPPIKSCRVADRYGRARLIPGGVAVGAARALVLAAALPLVPVQVAIITLRWATT